VGFGKERHDEDKKLPASDALRHPYPFGYDQ
jgi:hypothetical protein